MCNLPGPGIEPVSPALAGRFLTTAPPGKSPRKAIGFAVPLVYSCCKNGSDEFQAFYMSELNSCFQFSILSICLSSAALMIPLKRKPEYGVHCPQSSTGTHFSQSQSTQSETWHYTSPSLAFTCFTPALLAPFDVPSLFQISPCLRALALVIASSWNVFPRRVSPLSPSPPLDLQSSVALSVRCFM